MASPLQVFSASKARNERLAVVSLYDAPTAHLCAEAGSDAILVGDSLGNVILGYETTISVTLEEMVIHTAAVARGLAHSSRRDLPLIADLPFGTYATVDRAVSGATALMRAGAHAVKLEGARPAAVAAVLALTEMGVPVMGHLGYTPQSALALTSVVQAKTAESSDRLLEEALRIQEAGCFSIVLEVVSIEAAARITAELRIPTIGIGAGPQCDGQVLVWHDLAGLTPAKPFRFVKRFAEAHAMLAEAARDYVHEVHSGSFPTTEHGWPMITEE